MSIQFTSRELNQDVARVKRAAREGLVVVTDRGKPDIVMMSAKAYRQLASKPASFIERLGSRDAADIDFQVDRRRTSTLRPAAFD